MAYVCAIEAATLARIYAFAAVPAAAVACVHASTAV
ncbi:MAG: hypothetical protein ACI9C2_002253, partial [Gammaproteobacteria bacterium]